MAQCPVCQNEIQSGFGMVLCSKCQTPLFFDIEGNIQTSSSEESEFKEDIHPIPQTVTGTEPNDENVNSQSNDNYDTLSIHQDTSFFVNSQLNQPEFDPMDPDVVSGAPDAGISSTTTADTDDKTDSDTNANKNEYATERATENESENIQMPGSGPMLYTIEIEGIDGSRLRSELYEELKDPRWGWVALEIINKVSMGKLILKDVNAVKASLLVNRLKALPLEIRWKQQL